MIQCSVDHILKKTPFPEFMSRRGEYGAPVNPPGGGNTAEEDPAQRQVSVILVKPRSAWGRIARKPSRARAADRRPVAAPSELPQSGRAAAAAAVRKPRRSRGGRPS